MAEQAMTGKAVAEQVIRLRIERRWSRSRLAKECQPYMAALTEPSILNLELGRRRVMLDEVPVFAKVFGVPLESFGMAGRATVGRLDEEGTTFVGQNYRLYVAWFVREEAEAPSEPGFTVVVVEHVIGWWLGPDDGASPQTPRHILNEQEEDLMLFYAADAGMARRAAEAAVTQLRISSASMS